MKCAACGYEHPGTYGEPCPACGAVAQDPFRAAAPSAPNPWAPPVSDPLAAPPPPAGGSGIPWEGTQDVHSMFETVKLVLMEAGELFARAEPRVSLNQAFLFALILGSVGGIVNQVWQLIGMGMIMQALPDVEGLASVGVSGVMGFVMVPVQVAMGMFVQAALAHVVLMMVSGGHSGFEATFRVVAYATGSVAPLYVIPGLGLLVGGIWAIVVMILGLSAIHGTSGAKAALAVLLVPTLCVCCIAAGIGAMVPVMSELKF